MKCEKIYVATLKLGYFAEDLCLTYGRKYCEKQRKHWLSAFYLLYSVVRCLTRNPGVLGSSRTGSSGFFRGSVLGQDTSEPQPSTDETQEDMNNVSCRRDMTEILLSGVKHHSINQSVSLTLKKNPT